MGKKESESYVDWLVVGVIFGAIVGAAGVFSYMGPQTICTQDCLLCSKDCSECAQCGIDCSQCEIPVQTETQTETVTQIVTTTESAQTYVA